AGGPHYLSRFVTSTAKRSAHRGGSELNAEALVHRIESAQHPKKSAVTHHLPGPTGELNRLSTLPRAPILCLGPGPEAAAAQHAIVTRLGGYAVEIAEPLAAGGLKSDAAFGGVVWWGDDTQARAIAVALAERHGPIVPLITDIPDAAHVRLERHLCVDTTAAGGNASLLAGSEAEAEPPDDVTLSGSACPRG
ncbi:MAG: bifunctional proline dehydrogenase/L-glutamate gamma-semialdehyde dehydrogenase, partial [Pseudomonadota bacterium]